MTSLLRSLQRASDRGAGSRTDTEQTDDDVHQTQHVVGTKRVLSSPGGGEGAAKRARLDYSVGLDSDETGASDTEEEEDRGRGRDAEPVRLGGRSSEMREDSGTCSGGKYKYIQYMYTVEPLVKDTPNNGHLSSCFDPMLI